MDRESISTFEPCIAPGELQEGDLVAYLEGVASPDVARHITRCPACAAEVKALRQVDTMFNIVLNRANTFDVTAISAPRTGAQSTLPERQQTQGKAFSVFKSPQIFSGMLKTGRDSLFHQKWLAWPRISFQGAWRMAPVVVLVFVLLGFTALVFQANLHNTIEPSTSTEAIIEKPSAIAPPRSLLIMLENELQTQVDQRALAYLPVKSETYWDKSLVVDPTSGNTYFIWIDNVNGYSTIYAARSTDDAQTLSNVIPISRGIDRAFNPVLAMDSQGSLYVIWRTRHHLEINIYFARSTDGGRTWSNSVRINSEVKQAFNPSLAVDTQGHLYVAWENQSVVGTDIYLAYSADGGQTWSKEKRMAN
jgi:hypothetical protein